MEWTKEQRDQAARIVIAKRFPLLTKDPACFELEVGRWAATGFSIEGDLLVDLQCELTAALDVPRPESEEIERLEDLLHRAKHIMEDVELGIDRKAEAAGWIDSRNEFAVLRSLPSEPGSGVQRKAVENAR